MSKKNVEVEEKVTSEEVVTGGMSELEKLQQEVAKMMEAARAEAANIIAQAKEAVGEIKEEAQEEAPTKDPYYEELVPVMLFKDSDKYKDDVFVAVNGESCLIQRGKPVHIKRKFALILEQSQSQDMATADMIAGLTSEYKEKENRLS